MADDSDYARWKASQKKEVSSRMGIREYLRSIDGSLRTIKRVAIYFMALSIIAAIFEILAAIGLFR
jgi:hypothetical protein